MFFWRVTTLGLVEKIEKQRQDQEEDTCGVILTSDRVATSGNLLLIQWRLVRLIRKSHHQ